MVQPRELFPLNANGGVLIAQENDPGSVRPFAATVAQVVVPQAGKHDQPSTQRSYTTTQTTSMDGRQKTDSHTDTQND